MGQDLAHKRPWLLLSLLFGLTYPLVNFIPVPGIWAIIWKMGGLAMLVPYALRRHHSGEFALLAGVLGLYTIGDGLVEINLQAGGFAFGLGHILAIYIYNRHRRVKPVISQQLLGYTVFFATPVIAYFLGGAMAAVYSLLLGAMAAMAWTSNFPRYRVGVGAMLFVLSDLLLFAREGVLGGDMTAGLGVWYFYYIGMLLITTGVVQTLVKRGHYEDGLGL